jgi:beta-phosphoglucomutase-like phosphatase (HAD superfamily)
VAELRGVIFDVDGTLAETEEAHRLAFNQAFRDLGFGWQWGRLLYRELLRVAGGKERLVYYWRQYQPAVLEREDPNALAARIHEVKSRHFAAMLERGAVPLRPGTQRLIEELGEAGVRLALATTASPGTVQALLLAHLGPGALSRFAAVGAGDCVPAKKPAPDVYRWVLERMGLTPGECLAIEDSENGLKSARGAGLEVVITLSTYTDGQDFRGARAVLSDLGEPGRPMRVVSGEGLRRRMVDLELLRHWHSKAVSSER